MSKDNGGPAFPQSEQWQDNMACHESDPSRCGAPTMAGTGLSLRDYFAAKAPVTIKDAQEWFQDIEGRAPTGGEIMTILASMSGMYADAMLLERNK